ncbi:hypothetical protein TELCIR_06814, partial [Teladorsagia circumcincta]
RKPANLSDVLSTSGDTTDLVRNLNSYVDTKIPPGLSIFVLIVLSVVAFALILMGRNIPHSLLSGAAYDSYLAHCRRDTFYTELNTSHLSYDSFSSELTSISTKVARPLLSAQRGFTSCGQRRMADTRLLQAFAWTFDEFKTAGRQRDEQLRTPKGCIWVYGSKPYVHFEEHMFEEHYCDWTLYWVAFWTCTIYLVMICILIILLIVLMAVLSSKESAETELET